MPKFFIKESVLINTHPASVYDKVADFNHWTVWSPWLIMEPEATVTVKDGGKSYAWEGDRVGSGGMKVTGEDGKSWVDYDLDFIKPFKSHAKVRFELTPRGEQTETTWLMDSSLPFFLFFMTRSMTAYISQDYRRGLAMLKDYVEQGDVGSRLEIVGETVEAGFDYLGFNRECTISSINEAMDAAFKQLWEAWANAKLEPSGPPFSLYHKFDPVNDQVSFTVGVPCQSSTKPPAGLSAGRVEAGPVYAIRQIGSYRHIGNAWALGYNLIQNKQFKPQKKKYTYEVYVNDPEQTPESELITEIRFPL